MFISIVDVSAAPYLCKTWARIQLLTQYWLNYSISDYIY